MKSSNSFGDLKSLLDAIKSSDVVENRVVLFTELGELSITEKAEVAYLIESLEIFWEDFTCLDISQCSMNKSILHVAAQLIEKDLSGCIGKFLGLGTKASMWCGKHLKMTLMSTEESPEEEHHSLFYQLLSDMLSFSAATISVLARYHISTSKDLRAITESFILEQLKLTKDSIAEAKRIHGFGSELQKRAHVVLDALVRLCRVYSNSVDWNLHNAKNDEDNKISSEEADHVDHVMNVIKYAIENFCELGVLAANDGGNLVSVLNLSWKGVVTLLQLGEGALAVKLNVAGVILTLVSLVTESLRCAADTWSLTLKEIVSITDAKKIFLPVKFYLINAVRIITQYPTEGFSVFKEIALCVVKILGFRISLGRDGLLRPASEVLMEILEPTSLHLLNSLLNATQVKQENKFQILDWLFGNGSYFDPPVDLSDNSEINSMNAIFLATSDEMHGVKELFQGRVALFLNILKGAPDHEEDVRHEMARKLGWLLNTLIDEDVYSSILVSEVPEVLGSSKKDDLVYQPMFCFTVHALKTFMVVASSSEVWGEIESFLLENFLHPHFLCWEIVTELWCFLLRHADPNMKNRIMGKLCSLLKYTLSPKSLVPDSVTRKIARSICKLVTYGSPSIADCVYDSILGNTKSQNSSNIYLALLMEGFQLNLLSEERKNTVKQNVVTDYFCFLERFDDGTPKACGASIYGAPVLALSAVLHSDQVSIADTDMKTLKFLAAIMHKFRNSRDNTMKDHYRRLLSETLWIFSNIKHSYSSGEMESVILELQNLFISREGPEDGQLIMCKPSLANFMAGLGHVELEDSDGSATSLAVWELYHMLLRERHWAFTHLAIAAFGYFAARTSCNQLWRFVPQDAALSFDLESGNEPEEERFMSELKVFLEKELAWPKIKPCPDQLRMLKKDGLILKERVQKAKNIDPEFLISKIVDVDDEKQSCKKRKLPDGICRGMELLKNGMKIMGDGLSEWQHNQLVSIEVHEKFVAQLSHLENVIAGLVSLADPGQGSTA